MNPLTRDLLSALRSEARNRQRSYPIRRLTAGVLASAREAWEAAGWPDVLEIGEKEPDERAAIVRWLRTAAPDLLGGLRDAPEFLADAIEAGKHLEKADV